MNYKENQRKYQCKIRNELFDDPGGGVYRGVGRDFVLQNRLLNLFKDFRQSAVTYFDDHGICWWDGRLVKQPSGHLLSSQVSCVNHLFALRESKSFADAVTKYIDPSFVEAVELPDESGFLAFEKVGAEVLGGEDAITRGINATSIDAFILARKAGGAKVLVLIEWKYTESYPSANKRWSVRKDAEGKAVRKTDRLENYRALLEKDACPLKWKRFEDYFYEPYYQLMRQTLLGWQMVERGDFGYGAEDWLHVHVIPEANDKLTEGVTSPGLKSAGSTLESTWKACLKDPSRYRIVSPSNLLGPLQTDSDAAEWLAYLKKRYWFGSSTIQRGASDSPS